MMMSAHQMQPMQMQPPASQTNCPNCQTPLTFPYGSIYIQCPSCSFAFNPQPPPMPQPPMPVQQAPQQQQQQHGHAGVNYINCLQCQALLSYAPTSVTIQCPKCMFIMDIPPARASAVNVMGGGMQGGAAQVIAAGASAAANSAASNKEAIAARKKRKDPNAPKRASNAYMVLHARATAAIRPPPPSPPSLTPCHPSLRAVLCDMVRSSARSGALS